MAKMTRRNIFAILSTSLAAVVCLPVTEAAVEAEKKKDTEPLSPEKIFELKFEGKVTVQFTVGEVHTVNIDSVFMPGLSQAQAIYAKGSSVTDGPAFCVIVVRDVATRLLRLGIEDPAEHFRGKNMRVSGTIDRLDRIAPQTGSIYRLKVSNLDQLEEIRQ